MSFVIGQICQIKTRYICADILNAKCWDLYIRLCEELPTILILGGKFEGFEHERYIYESHKCTKIVYSDASATGYAGYEINTINGISHGMWSQRVSVKLST